MTEHDGYCVRCGWPLVVRDEVVASWRTPSDATVAGAVTSLVSFREETIRRILAATEPCPCREVRRG